MSRKSSRTSLSSSATAAPTLKESGYTQIRSYSLILGDPPDPKLPLPNTIHSCYTIEKLCIEAGYAINNVNLPFRAFCNQCIKYRDEINIGNPRITKSKNQWSCGRSCRCSRLLTWRTGSNSTEKLYETNTIVPPAVINQPSDFVELPKPTPPPASINSVKELSATDALLKLHIQQDTTNYHTQQFLAENIG